jgi:glutamate carboxypeptidase
MTNMPTLDAHEILEGIRAWVEIESPSDEPAHVDRMMDAAQAEYAAFGASIERVPGRDGRGDHLVVQAPWNRDLPDVPGILILSHLDTVHPLGTLAGRLPFRVEGDEAYGPGIYDMKGGCYIAMHAVRHLARLGKATPLPVTHLIVSDEEVGSPTSRALIEALGAKARHVLVTEPARDGGRIVVARKGTAMFRLEAWGRPSHAGTRPQDGRSAVNELARQILELAAMTDFARGITVNVGVIGGGTKPNVVAEHAWAEIDMRVPTVESGEEMVARIRALTPRDPDVRLVVTGGLNRPPYETSPATRALFEHARALAAEVGIEDLQGVATGGGSDGNFTAATRPTLDGLGVDGAGAHTLEERMLVSSIVPRTRLLLRLLETLE